MTEPVTIRVLGVGMGPQHVTPEVAEALSSCDYVIAAAKHADPGGHNDDELLALRRAICEAHGVELVAVPDPVRASGVAYETAVHEWHAARVGAYREVIASRRGTVGFLVWGDPSLYDSTIRVVAQLAALMQVEYDVLPGVSAPQVLAARHRIVLHAVGDPVHVTTARRLRDDLAAGQTNLVVMLGGAFEPALLDGLSDWSIWWGANLGTPSEALTAGRVGEVVPAIQAARARAKERAGWVMDVYLLRAPETRS